MKTLLFVCSLLFSTIVVGNNERTALEDTVPAILPVLVEAKDGERETSLVLHGYTSVSKLRMGITSITWLQQNTL